MKSSDLRWGNHSVVLEAPALWGARAILNEHDNIDILWDRQDTLFETDAIGKAFHKLLMPALEKFRKQAVKGKIRVREDGSVFTVGKIEFHTTTCKNSGYLYITARQCP